MFGGSRNKSFGLFKASSISPFRLAVLIISFALAWSIFLFLSPVYYNEVRIKESDRLKSQIVRLSKEYISSLAKEKGSDIKDVDENQKTALLLQHMLQRIGQLEAQLQGVIINSTKMVSDIKTLNHTIMITLGNSTIKYTVFCDIPTSDPAFPHCADKVAWLQKNWKSQKKFAEKGVNGSVCSILRYLSQVEEECPKNFKVSKKAEGNTQNGEPLTLLSNDAEVQTANVNVDEKCNTNINDPAFPSCKAKIEWLKTFWKSDPIYSTNGVDGSTCSFVHFLSEVETWCPLQQGRKPSGKDCVVPKVTGFPNCDAKVAWMRKFWTSDPCYKGIGVNGTICSFIVYLSEVERWCPLFPGRSYYKPPVSDNSTVLQKLPNVEDVKLQGLLSILSVGGEKKKYDWIASRIKRMWPTWIRAQNNLMKKVDLKSYEKKRIFIYIGLLADEKVYHFGELSSKGGPLGELVQWSDVIASLYLLGHQITIVMNKTPGAQYGIKKMLRTSIGGQCPTSKKSQYDIIYTDYIGVSHMIRTFKNINGIKCYLRVVDSFGTEAEFNLKVGNNFKNMYGYHGLNLKQYNTMFPHSPDNSFLGFVVENQLKPGQKLEKKKRIALVYGKHINMWQDPKQIAFLDLVQKYFEVHATVGGDEDKTKNKVKYALPSYVINHGVLKGDEIQQLLRESTLFVGIGFPFEGPAPLEAIANGCFFLNVKLDPPLGRANSKFFKGKPTQRKLTSQHPYAERYIGKPYVYTVNVNNPKEVEAALEDMDDKVSEPYLPYEYSNEGMLERLYMFTKHHDFCENRMGDQFSPKWPPMSSRQVFIGDVSMGCDEVCAKQDLICEPAFFPTINNKEQMKGCVNENKVGSLVAPAYKIDPNVKDSCLIQSNHMLYSCTAKSPSSKRVCPCRDYVRGQTALCKDCLDGVK